MIPRPIRAARARARARAAVGLAFALLHVSAGSRASAAGHAPAAAAPRAAWVASPTALSLATNLRHEALMLGDTLRAPYSPWWSDTLWSRVLEIPSPWEWDAVSHLATHRLGAGDATGADSVLGWSSIADWPAEDRAARLALAARVQSALRDTAAALSNARQAMRAFPSLPGARAALATLDTLMSARRDSSGPADDALAAEVLFFSGERPAAIARLARAFDAHNAPERWRIGVRLGEMERLSRRLIDAEGTLARAAKLAPDSSARGRVWLERARVERDAGSAVSAYSAYARAAALAPGTATAEAAEWELAREAEEQGESKRADRAYTAVERLGLKRASDARMRRGLLLMNAGEPSRARACFAGVRGEAGQFWWAIAAAESSRSARLAALDSLARTPGYSFYRVAARESLALAGWPDSLPPDAPAASPGSELLWLAQFLTESGRGAEAAALLDRWAADDPRALAPADGIVQHPLEMLRASQLEARAGRPREGVRLAQRACDALSNDPAPLPWVGWPLVYPTPPGSPGDSALAAVGGGIEPALLRALIWKESHFDSTAISRTGAIGLMQLMPETGRVLARQAGDPAPTDSMLALPLLNVRYGAAYFASLMRRCGGRVTLGLAAYNAGTRAADRWSDLYRRGGEAMQCELIAYPETQDYVKGILAARAAYRELARARGPR